MDSDWSITEFKLAAYGFQLDRDGESWKTRTIAASVSKRDIEKLRGEWRVTNKRPRNQRPRSQDVEVTKFEDSSFLFTDSHLTVTGTERRVAEITLRDNSSPKEIDLEATKGVGAGKTAYGIYRFDGDRLVLCIGEVRPVKFSDDDDAGLLVLERRQIDDESLTTPTPIPVDIPRAEIEHATERATNSIKRVLQYSPAVQGNDTAATNAISDQATAIPDWVVAWDFRYTLMNQRYAMMRVSKDGQLEAIFPEQPLVRSQLTPEELAEIVDLVAKNPQSKTQPKSMIADYSVAVGLDRNCLTRSSESTCARKAGIIRQC